MKSYMYTMILCSRRTGEHIGKTVGVILAEDTGDAEQKAWRVSGGDTKCSLRVWEVTDDPCDNRCTVYKAHL